MKMFKIITSVLMILFPVTSVSVAGEGPCEGVTIKWMQTHVPIPPAKILSKTPESGLCQVVLKIGNEFVPTYAGKNFVVAGEMFRNRIQLTQAKIESFKQEATLSRLEELETAVAITYIPEEGTGKSVYVLTDPLCPYCNRAGKELKTLADETGATFKVVFANVHGPKGEAKIKEAICNGYDFEKYNTDDWKTQPPQNAECVEAGTLWGRTQQVVAKLGIKGVPAFLTEAGGFVSGANIPALKKAIADMNSANLQAKVQ